MAFYVKSNNTVSVHSSQGTTFSKKLEVGLYYVKYNQVRGYYLERAEQDFEKTKKIYGDTNTLVKRISDTFLKRPNNTGVLLEGVKGSGKTLLAKELSIFLAEKYNIPTIIINENFYGSEFNTFIQTISDEVMVIFDEFEKVYDDTEHQTAILTLLDGVVIGKKLYVFTVNNKYKIDDNMMNRPGRIFYAIQYKGITSEFVQEYCEDNLKNKSYIENVVSITQLIDDFNFDALQALIEEMNRYDESPSEALKLLNINPSNGLRSNYRVYLKVNNKKINVEDDIISIHSPLNFKNLTIHNYSSNKRWIFNPKEIVEYNKGKFVYKQGNAELVLIKEKEEEFRRWNEI